MMRTQLYARLLPCSVRGRAARPRSGRVVVCRGPYAACTITSTILPTQLGRGTGINCCIFLPIKRTKMLPKSPLRPSHLDGAGLCSGVGSRGGATLRVLPLGAVSRPGRCVGCGDWGGMVLQSVVGLCECWRLDVDITEG